MSIDLLEQVGYWHFAHSFVRGNWRREEDSAFVLLAKSCHDMDYLSWLANRPCLKVSSYGQLGHFRKELAPTGRHPALRPRLPRLRLRLRRPENLQPRKPRLVFRGRQGRCARPERGCHQGRDAEGGSFGRCVYHCDNDVADHQGVLLEFEGGLVATFTLSAFTTDCARRLRVQGTEGELEMTEEQGGQRIKWRRFNDSKGTEIFASQGAGQPFRGRRAPR